MNEGVTVAVGRLKLLAFDVEGDEDNAALPDRRVVVVVGAKRVLLRVDYEAK